MPTQSRPKNTSVVQQLSGTPHAYSFVQAMRLLERATVLQKPTSGATFQLHRPTPVGGFSPPEREVLRLCGDHTLEFPESEVLAVEKASGRWRMILSHIGLTGSMGVLPFHYTELILQRLKQKDFSLSDFLDLFNHRISSLYYQASVKYRLPVEYEREHLFGTGKSTVDTKTQALLSVVGMGTSGLTNRSVVPDEALIFHGGLFSSQVRTASGLKQILEHHFAISVSIQEFVGQWQELIPDIRTRLGSRRLPKGQNAALGRTVMLGRKGWFSQGKIKIHLGPLNYEQFSRFAPGTSSLRALNDLVRLYVGVEQDFSFVIQVQRDNFPRQISLNKNDNPQMGWNTWLSGSSKSAAKKDVKHLNIHVSANRLK